MSSNPGELSNESVHTPKPSSDMQDFTSARIGWTERSAPEVEEPDAVTMETKQREGETEHQDRPRREQRSPDHLIRFRMEESGSAAERPSVTSSPCLLDNWLEERAAAGLDRTPCPPGLASKEPDHRHGHKGILTTQLLAGMATSTNHQDSYGRPSGDNRRHTGLREEQLRRELYHKFSQDILEELKSPTKEMDIRESTTKIDYEVKGFVPQIPAPRKKHDYHTEQAVTFWTENVHAITGISDIRSRDSPFKRSSAFTTPTSHYLDQPLPHDLENYPNM